MRISTNLINDSYSVTISKQDSWLERTARDIAPSSPETADISGNLELRQDRAGFVHVTGKIMASALRPCDRCGQLVKLPIVAEITAEFRPPYASVAPREMTLSYEDMDTYFLENGCVDIEQVVNDAIQCAIPAQIHCQAFDGSQPCDNTNDSNGLIYGETLRDDESSPFSILKDFRPS